MGEPLKYKSAIYKWSNAAGAADIVPHSFVEKKGPNGGRVVVDRVIAHAEILCDVATAAILGADFYRFFRLLTLKMTDGTLRFNEMPGDAMRVWLIENIGAAETKEHADSAVANGQTLQATCVMPLAKPFMKDGRDYSMASDLFDSIRIAYPSSGDVSLGTSAVTITSGNYWFIAECHEEFEIVHHSIDEVRVQDFASTSAVQLEVITGGRLQELLGYVPGASGGQTLANLTEIWIQGSVVAPQLRVKPDLQEYYARARKAVTGAFSTTGNPIRSDPFVAAAGGTTRAVAVLMATDTKGFDGQERASVTVNTTLAGALPASLRVISRIAKRRNEDTKEAVRKKFKLKGQWRVKTKGNTMRHPGAWTEDQIAYLPIKFTA